MASQEQVNHLQQSLVAGESACKTAVSDILDAVANDPNVSPGVRKAIVDSAKALRRNLIAFHSIAALASVDAGVQPLSGGQDKDGEDD